MMRFKFGNVRLTRVTCPEAVGETPRRINDAKDLAYIVQYGGLPHDLRAYSLSLYCCPRALYGCAVQSYAKSQLHALSAQMFAGWA